MSVLNVQKIVALLLAGLGVFLVVQGQSMAYYGRFGPGSGFLAVWVGGGIAVLALVLFVQTMLSRADVDAFMTESQSARRPLIMGSACLVAMIAIPVLGFRLAMLLFLLAVPNIAGRQKILPLAIFAIVGSLGVAWIFENLLRVRLPAASFEALRAIGL